jgi:hypothetical protein
MLNFALESLIFNTGFLKKKNDFIISERIDWKVISYYIYK